MTTLTWNDALALQHPQLDRTHEEFVILLGELQALLEESGGNDPLPLYARLLAHTEAHFSMEEAWMAATGFAPDNCHSRQHAMVLDVMRQVQVHCHRENDLAPLRNLAEELVNWFPAHAEMMDAALVFHMAQLGYEPATGAIARPVAADAVPITSCGNSGCTPAATATAEVAR